MIPLIQKDIYVLWRQLKIILVLILIFSCIPNSFNNFFAVVYATMIPYTAMAYDERSKWDQMAATMPYSDWDIVLSKYVLGWLLILAALVLSCAIQFVLSLFFATGFALSPLLMAFFAALCILAVTLPLLFRFGVEKARILMFLMVFLVCGSAGFLASVVSEPGLTAGPSLALAGAGLGAAAVVLTAVSVPLSVRMYRRDH